MPVLRLCSSMDRMGVSGTLDIGSIPIRATLGSRCREKMSSIETNLSNGSKAMAASQIASFVAANNIETNYKRFFEIYKAYTDSTYNGSDSLDLITIAYKCPFSDGSVVYQARALFNMIYTSVVLFSDNCPVEDDTNTRHALNGYNEKISNLKWTADLYPNPATNDLFITGSNENEVLQVIITDVSGKQVESYTLKTQAHTAKLLLDLNSGIYFVTLSNSNNETVVKKLVISK